MEPRGVNRPDRDGGRRLFFASASDARAAGEGTVSCTCVPALAVGLAATRPPVSVSGASATASHTLARTHKVPHICSGCPLRLAHRPRRRRTTTPYARAHVQGCPRASRHSILPVGHDEDEDEARPSLECDGSPTPRVHTLRSR